MAKSVRRSDCPINYATEIFGDRWTFLIIRDLMFKGKRHYNEFLNSEEGIATNILADRLTQLEHNKIISRKQDPANGSKFLYHLTSKGADLAPLMVEMIVWSAKHDKKTAADMGFVNAAASDRKQLLDEIRTALR